MKSIIRVIGAITLLCATGAKAATFEYLWLAGSTFHPLSSSASFQYPGSGCISPGNSSNGRFAHKVVLPTGAVINYLRLYAYDASAEGSVGSFLTTYDATGSFNEVLTVSSATTGGYSSWLSPLAELTVDNASTAINIVVNLGTSLDNNLRFCGIRIAYIPLPENLIFTNDFE